MKKIFLLILPLFVLSCNRSLDKFPLDKLSDADFFSTEEGLKAFSNNFYGILPGPSSQNNASLCCLDHADNYFRNIKHEVIGDTRLPASSGTGDWNNWDYLRDYNTLLDNSKQCPDVAVRTQYEALARFFRAYFYFEKVRRFGDVPWYDTQLGSGDEALYKERDSRDTVIRKVVADLDFAIANLTGTKSAYTITKWTAMALKSRVCLFEGTYQKYHGLNAEFAGELLRQCVEVSDAFIKESGYSLYSTGKPAQDYFDLFAADKYAGHPAACEVVLARNYNALYDNGTHRLHAILLTSGEGATGMSRKAVVTYLNADGTRFTDKPEWWKTQFYEELQGRDPRLAQSIRYPGYTRIGEEKTLAPDLANNVSGYQPTKFLAMPNRDTHGQSDCDIILFRAGEIYLNYAEAKAELGTITQNDLDLTVNALRKRVGMISEACKLTTGVQLDTFLISATWGGYRNQTDPLILEIRRERMCELNQEGFRYFDLMRWKEGHVLTAPQYGMYFPGPGEYDLDHNGTVDVCLYTEQKPADTKAALAFKIGSEIYLSGGQSGMIDPFQTDPNGRNFNEERDYLYPLPYQELRLNKKLTQNPGWPDGRGEQQ